MSPRKIDALDLRRIPDGGAVLAPPDASALSGRHARRSGASIQGTLSNWVRHVVTARTAEREKLVIGDRALDLYTNDAMAHGILDGLPVEIVGTGLTPQAQPMTDWLGLDQEWLTTWQRRVWSLFEIWGLDARNHCDAQRRCNIYMLQSLALFTWKLSGIAVFQVRRASSPFSPIPLSVLPVDPFRLVTPSDKQGENVYDGLELDDDGAVVAAWIRKPSVYPTASLSNDCLRIPVTDAATGLPNLLLVCDVRHVSEYRQDSVLACMIKEIRDNNDFVDAALVKALISNLFTVFIQNSLGQTTNKAVRWEDRIHELEKGTVIMGSMEEQPHIIQGADSPGPSYEIMNNGILGRLGMATGRGPENISRAYRSSYSASQASIENAGKYDDTDRMVLVDRFCQPLMAWMQYLGVLRGLLPVASPARFLSELHAYTRTEWLPPKLRPIDKVKAAKADDIRLINGTRTYADIYGEQSRDWRAGISQWIAELALMKEEAIKYGMTLEEVLALRSRTADLSTVTDGTASPQGEDA